MPEHLSLSGHALPEELQTIIREQIASGRCPDALSVVETALHQLEQGAPADGAASASGPVYDLAQLNLLHTALEAARSEREFIIGLTARQRRVPHPEAIMQLTAEAIGERLQVDRVGF